MPMYWVEQRMLAVVVTVLTSASGCSPTAQLAVSAGDPPERIDENASEVSSAEPVRSDGPYSPEGMTFVPGGEFTEAQLERVQRQGRYEMRPRVSDFCLAIGEVSREEHDECCLAAVCCSAEEASRIRRFVELRTPEENRNPRRRISSSCRSSAPRP